MDNLINWIMPVQLLIKWRMNWTVRPKSNTRDTMYAWFLWQGHWNISVEQHKIPSIRALLLYITAQD